MVAVVAGGSGLIGGHLLRLLAGDSAFDKVIALTRKPLDRQFSQTDQRVINFHNLHDLENAFLRADVIFSAIGTTSLRVGGDQDAYRNIDFDIPVNLANTALRKGARQFVLVSSVGANPGSRNFYLRLKGEIEDAISIIGFETVLIIRPSVLLGNRKEKRPMEKFAQKVMLVLAGILPGPLRKYRAIDAHDVALAMIEASKKGMPANIFCVMMKSAT